MNPEGRRINPGDSSKIHPAPRKRRKSPGKIPKCYLAAGRDFAYPQTQGQRPEDLEESTQYFADVDALTAEDLEVQRLMAEVLNLAKPLSALREEPLRSRVEAYARGR